jgi:hypothetical protein
MQLHAFSFKPHRLLISAEIIQDQLHNASISSRHAFFDLDLCTAKF